MKSMRISNKKLLLSIFLITPFIDIVNALLKVRNISSIISFGQIIRVTIWCIMLYLLNKVSRLQLLRVLLLTILVFIKDIIYFVILEAPEAPLISNIICDLRYLYVLTFGVTLFSYYKKAVVSKEEVYLYSKKSVSIFAITTFLTNTFGVGLQYVSTKRLFTEVNALTAILGEFTKFESVIMALITIYVTFSQATKTGLLGVVIIFVYLLVYIGVVEKKRLKCLLLAMVTISGGAFIFFYFVEGLGADILTRWKYFYRSQDIITFLLSDRNTLFKIAYNVWKRNILFVFFGLSSSYANEIIYAAHSTISYAGAEMDLFDIGFYYGLMAFLGVAIFLGKRFIQSLLHVFKRKGNGYFNFIFIIFCIVSFLGGHVLSSPMAGVIFSGSLLLSSPD